MGDPRAANPAAAPPDGGDPEAPHETSGSATLPADLANAINNALASLLSNLELAAEVVGGDGTSSSSPARLIREASEGARRVQVLVEQVPVALPPGASHGSVVSATTSAAPAASRSSNAARKVTVLVVDDEAAIGRIITRALDDCSVVALTDAREALVRIATGASFDLILCDLMMPTMSGMDFYEELVRLAPQQVQRVVFMTGGAATTRAQEFVSTVPRSVVSKPLDLAELRSLVRERASLQGRLGGSVLVVDDDEASRKLIIRWLGSAKINCVERPSGQAALDLLAADPDAVDAVVLDVTMPGMDGFEVAARLKASPSTAAIPVLMVTAHATSEHQVTQGMEAGAVDYLAKPFSGPVLVAKVRAACERRRAERELQARLRSAEVHASTDALTGLMNRRAFDEELRRALEHAASQSEPLALALLDLDHFKRINDTYGHPGGDELLAYFAQAVRRAVRKGDQAFRYGGEEFALLLPKCGTEAAVRVVTRIQRDLREGPVSLAGGAPVVARFSAGIAAAEARNEFRVEALIARADAALYEAKRLGRDRIEVEE